MTVGYLGCGSYEVALGSRSMERRPDTPSGNRLDAALCQAEIVTQGAAVPSSLQHGEEDASCRDPGAGSLVHSSTEKEQHMPHLSTTANGSSSFRVSFLSNSISLNILTFFLSFILFWLLFGFSVVRGRH